MTYVFLYFCFILFIFWISYVGWVEACKTIIRLIIPSALIILLNIKAGHILFRSPIIGLVSLLPTAFLIYRGSKPLVNKINSFIDIQRNEVLNSIEIVDAEVLSKEDA